MDMICSRVRFAAYVLALRNAMGPRSAEVADDRLVRLRHRADDARDHLEESHWVGGLLAGGPRREIGVVEDAQVVDPVRNLSGHDLLLSRFQGCTASLTRGTPAECDQGHAAARRMGPRWPSARGLRHPAARTVPSTHYGGNVSRSAHKNPRSGR